MYQANLRWISAIVKSPVTSSQNLFLPDLCWMQLAVIVRNVESFGLSNQQPSGEESFPLKTDLWEATGVHYHTAAQTETWAAFSLIVWTWVAWKVLEEEILCQYLKRIQMTYFELLEALLGIFFVCVFIVCCVFL